MMMGLLFQRCENIDLDLQSMALTKPEAIRRATVRQVAFVAYKRENENWS